jgi:hypothetical protein
MGILVLFPGRQGIVTETERNSLRKHFALIMRWVRRLRATRPYQEREGRIGPPSRDPEKGWKGSAKVPRVDYDASAEASQLRRRRVL